MTSNTATVTIKDVARLADVSPMTVSRVINASERVSPETRRRVEQAISELGYVPSRLASGLSRQRTGTLALIVPDVANPFFTLIVRGAEDVARRAGFRVLLCDTRADLDVEREVIEEMIAHRVEGIVIAPVSDRSKSNLRRLAKFGVPFVLIDRTVSGIESDVVLGDSFGGARQLVEHLISLGHRRIGFIVESDEVSTARDRRRGYESALTAAGIPVDPALVADATVDPSGGTRGCAGCSSSRIRPPRCSPSTTSSLSARSKRCAQPVSRFPTTWRSSASTTSNTPRACIRSSRSWSNPRRRSGRWARSSCSIGSPAAARSDRVSSSSLPSSSCGSRAAARAAWTRA